MKRAITLSMFLAAIAIGAGSSAAPSTTPSPTAPGVGAAPRLVAVPPFLTSVEVINKTVDAGGIAYRLRFSNPSKVAFHGEISVWRGNQRRGLPIAKTPLVIAAGANAGEATYVDPAGVADKCEFIRHLLSWSAGGAFSKMVITSTTCTFASTLTDPTAPVPPDTLQAQRQGKLFYLGSKIDQAMACSSQSRSPLLVSATVKNNTSKTIAKAILDLDGTPITPVATNVAPGGGEPVTGAGNMYRSGRFVLKLVDVDNSANGAVWQPGHFVDVKRTCTVEAALYNAPP